jgi:hypothetical protein
MRSHHGYFDRSRHGCGSEASARWAERMEARARRFAQRLEDDGFFGAASLGVRRPLRFLAYRLDLSDEQASRLARILERLKLEKARAALEMRSAMADLADAVEAERFERGPVEAAGQRRAEAARQVQEAVARALEEVHALLEPAQRAGFAELLRVGSLRI